MKSITDHLSQYAAYHRDRRNIITHFIGIPLIVFAVAGLLGRPALSLFWLPVAASPAMGVATIAAVFYLRLHLGLGALMVIFLSCALWIGNALAEQNTMSWLLGSMGLFIVGWVIQFIGHFYEGRKPAFIDDIMGLAVGPLFVVAELVFLCGGYKHLEQAITDIAGPVRKKAY